MTITDTDRKYLNMLLERKPDATAEDVIRLIEEMNIRLMNTHEGCRLIENEIWAIEHGYPSSTYEYKCLKGKGTER